MVPPQTLQRKAELIHRAGLEVLQQDIRARDQLFKAGAAFGGGEVDHQRMLAAIEPDEITALSFRRRIVGPCEIAFRPFHLDHVRAGIRQARRAEWCCNRLFDGDDFDSLKRQHLPTSQ